MIKNLPSLLMGGVRSGCVGILCAAAMGQARPTASGPGFALPTVGGTLRYSLSTAESLSQGIYNTGGVVSSTSFSGNLAFITPGVVHPFSLIESGGYIDGNSGQPSTSFEDLLLSQTLLLRRWSYTASNNLNYSPTTPTTGLSGVPGVGDINANPAPPVGSTNSGEGLGVLSVYGPRISNSTSLAASRPLTGSLFFQVNGNYTMLRFLGGTGDAVNGIDSNVETGSTGLDYRVDARNRTGVTYSYNKSSFLGQQFTFTTQSVTGSYSRQWTRRLSTFVSGGPLKLSSSEAALSGPSVNFTALASVNYAGKEFTQTLGYVRDTSTGSGVIAGAISDSVFYGVNRTFGRALGVAGTVGYARTKSILVTQPFDSEGVSASVQVTRALSPHISAFAAYTLQDQLLQQVPTGSSNAFSGIYQVASFGVTYSPSVHRLGAQ